MKAFSGLALWLFMAALLWGSSAPAAQVNWVQSYFNSGHASYNKSETTLSAGNVSGLQQVWGQSTDNCHTFADALDNGTIYEMGQESDCNTWNLQALDAATGAVKWDVPIGNPGTSSGQTLATGARLVFSACAFQDSGGNLYGAMCAYSQSDGHLVWQNSSPCDCAPESHLAAQPVYSDGNIYYGYGNGGGTCAGDIEYVVAANAKTGAQQWTYVTGTCNSLSNAAITVAGGVVYFGCGSGVNEICAVSQSNGSLLWQSANLVDPITALVATKGAIYVDVCGTNALVALDAATGAENWSNSSLYCNGQSMASLAGGNLYYVAPGHQFVDLRARNGKLIWSVAAGQVPTGSASIANGVVYVPGGPNDGRSTGTAAYDASSGALLWNSNFSGSSYGVPPPPIVANGVVYGTNDSTCGAVCAYALPTGQRTH